MKILLVNPPIRLDAKPNCIPTGLAIIAAFVRSAGHKVELFDCNGLRSSKKQVYRKLSQGWDIIGFSGLITTYKWQTWAIKAARFYNRKALIVSGGGLATSCPHLVDADVVVMGEGESAMIDICNGKRGLIRGKGSNLDDLPFPAWDLLPMETYLKNPIWGDVAGNSSRLPGVSVDRSMNVITSRGCPYSCNYCYHLFDTYRQRSVQSVVDEVGMLIGQYGVDFVGFVDDNMMASRRWILEFCKKIQGFKIRWGCHGRVTNADVDILESMAAAGCVWIGYGIESGSQKILDAMNKKQTVSQAKAAVINTRKAGIFPNTTFIFGYPGETPETVAETIEFKKDLGLECGSFFCTPYPGTVLYEQVRHKLGYEIDFIKKLGNATEFVINLTDMQDDEFHEQKWRYDMSPRC